MGIKQLIVVLMMFLISFIGCATTPQEMRDEDSGYIDIKESQGFCGSSTYGECSFDFNCVKSGCSGQICQSKNEEPMVSICLHRDCYDAKAYQLRCKCAGGECQWSR